MSINLCISSSLDSNRISDEGAKFISQAHWPNLTSIKLGISLLLE